MSSRAQPRFRRIFSAMLVAAMLSSGLVHADGPRWAAPAGEPSKAALDEAHARYIAGNRAVEQGRWADAPVDFEKAYALSGVPSALFNVATTLRALGRHREARDAFALLLRRHGAKLDAPVRKDAETLRTEEAARVAVVVLDDLPAKAPQLRVYVDGVASPDDGSRPLAIEIDSGRHALRVEEPSSQTFAWEGTFTDGERKPIQVRLVSRATVSALPDGPKGGASSSSSLWSSPIFWTAVGVVVVGGAATGGYFWHKGRQVEPQSGLVVKL
jgi:menaquinone-dependent protoporphyrinogen IX oxidase